MQKPLVFTPIGLLAAILHREACNLSNIEGVKNFNR